MDRDWSAESNDGHVSSIQSSTTNCDSKEDTRMFGKKIIVLSLTTLATFATIGTATACSADLSDDMAGPVPTPTTTTHLGLS